MDSIPSPMKNPTLETFKSVNGVPTKVACHGKFVDDDLSSVKHLVLIFPGNPGVVEYYKEFMTEIHARLVEKYPTEEIPVWGISHGGHQMDELHSSLFPDFQGNQHLYSVKGQSDHKSAFLATYIPSHIKVIGVGHSIGCKTWSEVLKQIDVSKKSEYPEISKCFMLFPTLERMRDTPNGKWFTPLLSYQSLVEPLLRLIMLFPTALHKFLLSMYFWGRTVPDSVINGSLELFKFHVYQRVVFMARCEMNDVYDLDLETLRNNVDKIHFYFGRTDKWCPLEYVDEMKEKLPQLNFKICDNGFEHAFVIKTSAEMAAYVCSCIDI